MDNYFDYQLVSEARPEGHGRLSIIFKDGTHGIFDCSPYWANPYWSKLKDDAFFRMVRVDCGTLTWPGDVDIAPEEVWHNSIKA